MRRIILTFAGALLFLVSSFSIASAESDLQWQNNANANAQGTCNGVYNSQISRNGGDISSNQTEYPGNRAERTLADLAVDWSVCQ